MRAGVTGSRNGFARDAQREGVFKILSRADCLHHGDCVGVDEECARAFRGETIAHPPDNVSLRSSFFSDIIMPAKPYLDRNRDIISSIRYLTAAPDGFQEKRRSGTWATIRYAKKVGVPVFIVYPDGSVDAIVK